MRAIPNSLAMLGLVSAMIGIGCVGPRPIEMRDSLSDPARLVDRERPAPFFKLVTPTHRGVVRSMRFSPDGRRLYSAGSDKVIRVIRIGSGVSKIPESVIHLPAGPFREGGISALAISPNGRWLAAGACFGCYGYERAQAPYRIFVIDTQQGQVIDSTEAHRAEIIAIEFSRDGSRLASASRDGTLNVWSIEEGRLWESANLVGHAAAVNDLAWGHDADRLFSVGADGRLVSWAPSEAGGWFPEIVSDQMEYAFSAVATSADASLLITASFDKALRVWDPVHCVPTRTLTTLEKGVPYDIRLAPDASAVAVAVGGGDEVRGVRIFPTSEVAGAERFRKHEGHPNGMAWGGGERSLLATSNGHSGSVLLFDPTELKLAARYTGAGRPVSRVGSLPDALAFAWSDYGEDELDVALVVSEANPMQEPDTRASYRGGIVGRNNRIYADFETGRLTLELGGQQVYTSIDELSSWVSLDTDLLAAGTTHGWLIALAKGLSEWTVCYASELRVTTMSVAPDGRAVAAGSGDQTVRVCNPATGELLLSIFVDRDRAWVAWTPDGLYDGTEIGIRYLRVQRNRSAMESPELEMATDSEWATREVGLLQRVLAAGRRAAAAPAGEQGEAAR